MSTGNIVQDIKALQQKVVLLINTMIEPVRICALDQLQHELSIIDDELEQVVFLKSWLLTNAGLSEQAVRNE